MSYPMPQKSLGLLEEAARMARLNHPNIVRIIAVSKLSFSAFRPMFAMEWLPGGSLAEFFRDQIRRKEERDREKVSDNLSGFRSTGLLNTLMPYPLVEVVAGWLTESSCIVCLLPMPTSTVLTVTVEHAHLVAGVRA